MRLTLVVPDSVFGVDGVFRTIDVSDTPVGVRVVQFDSTKGQGITEYYDLTNVNITDFSQFQVYLDRWNALTPAPLTAAQQAAADKANTNSSINAQIAALELQALRPTIELTRATLDSLWLAANTTTVTNAKLALQNLHNQIIALRATLIP